MDGFIGFVCIILGILNIILFFKVWGMCNDVKRMADHSSLKVRLKLGMYRLRTSSIILVFEKKFKNFNK